jgi:hypothetical protein
MVSMAALDDRCGVWVAMVAMISVEALPSRDARRLLGGGFDRY